MLESFLGVITGIVFFGIMKGRFCILKYGFIFQTIADCDKTWLTCCALHNMLLEIDGLHKNWENGVCSDWENFYYHSQLRNAHENIVTSFAIDRLNRHPINNFQNATFNVPNIDVKNISEYCKKYDRWKKNCFKNAIVSFLSVSN